MKKPYADSTLRTKYKQTGIEQEKINTMIIYLTACVNFYKLIELEDAWRVIGKKCKKFGDVSRTDFDALVPIFARDGHLAFYMKSEKELYADGKDKLLLIDKDYLLVANDEFSEMDRVELIRYKERNEPYEGPLPMEEDWDRFYALDQHQQGKELYIADDIIRYVDPEYIAETPQVDAMRRFLLSEVELEIPSEIQEEAKAWSAKKKKTEFAALRGEAANATIQEMHRLICDVSVSVSEAFSLVLKCMEDFKYQISGFGQVNRLMKLFTEMSNNTRMPSNRGFTPQETMRKLGSIPKRIEFGPGITKV